MAVEFPSTACALVLRGRRAVAICDLVLARSRSRRDILSAPFLRSGWDSDRECFLVRKNRPSNRYLDSYAAAFRCGGYRIIRDLAAETCGTFVWMARSHDSLHHFCRLWESTSVVSAPARADCGGVRWCGLRLICVEVFPRASHADRIVDLVRWLFWPALFQICASRLPITVLRGVARSRFGIEEN